MIYENTKFWNMFRTYGGMKRIYKSPDFTYSLLISSIFSTIIWYLGVIESIIYTGCPLFINISGIVIGIAIVGLAIFVSMSDKEFIGILRNGNVYENILFVFLIVAYISSLSIITEL